MTAMSKQDFRRMLRSRRSTQQERDAQSEAICRHILDSAAYQSAQLIAGYCALAHEADISSVLKAALKQGKMVALPLCGTSPEMTLHVISSLDDLRPGRYGILEPPVDAPVCDAAELDLILVPLEGIDNDGYRIGKGGGYYDCLLSNTNAYSMGCALTWQMVDKLPRSEWDKPLNSCAHDDGIREFDR